MLHFADDNTISAAENTVEKLIFTLEQDSEAAISWFKINEMILNPDKFQAIAVKKNYRIKDSCTLNINNQTINSENCVKLFEIEIDNTLSFSRHISTLGKKASNQLNAIERIIVIRNRKIVWKVAWIGYYLQLNVSSRRY